MPDRPTPEQIADTLAVESEGGDTVMAVHLLLHRLRDAGYVVAHPAGFRNPFPIDPSYGPVNALHAAYDQALRDIFGGDDA